MTYADRIKQLSGLAGVTAAVMLLSIGAGGTAGAALVDYSKLASGTATQHLLVDHAAVVAGGGSGGGASGGGWKRVYYRESSARRLNLETLPVTVSLKELETPFSLQWRADVKQIQRQIAKNRTASIRAELEYFGIYQKMLDEEDEEIVFILTMLH